MAGIKFAGDVTIKQFEIEGRNGKLDITQLISQIQIFEDVFSPFITGNVVINESLDLVNKMPLGGEEFFNIHIFTPTYEGDTFGEIKGRFAIYRMTERQNLAERGVVYTLHFVSMEARVDVGKKIRSAFEGYPHDIAKKLIYEDDLGMKTERDVHIEDTKNSIKFVCNNWTPMRALNYCASKAVNKDDSPTFVFFENRRGFNFISFTGLYKQEPLQKFIKDNYRRDPTDPKGGKNIDEEYKRVSSYRMPSGFDFFKRIQEGMFVSQLTTYDFVTKAYQTYRYNGLQEFQGLDHLNPHPLMSPALFNDQLTQEPLIAETAALFHLNQQQSMYEGFNDVSMNDKFLERRSLLAQAEAFKIEIEVAGRTDYTAGAVVEFTTNRNEPISPNDDDPVDRMMSGKYLISSINHVITPSEHRCHMELIKESLSANFTGLE